MISEMGAQLTLLIGGIVAFVAVFFLVTGCYALLGELGVLRRAASGADGAVQEPAQRISIEDDFLSRISRFVTPGNPDEVTAVRLRLVRAGYRRPSALRVFYLAKGVFGLAFALIGALISSTIKTALPAPILLCLLIFPFVLGFLLPPLWVDRQAARRAQDAEQGFPDTLDMLLVCIEAGQSFDQACRRVAREIKRISPVLFQEFAILNEELRAGRDRTMAFRDFSDRLGVGDINAFVTVLRQSDEFGVSIGEALRVYAADMRDKRLIRAEEKANIMPLKLALGSMFFTVPPTMLVMAGPSLLMLMRTFAKMGGH